MSSENTDRGKPFVYLFSDCNVGQQHEFFNKVVCLNHLIKLDISGAVGFFLQGYLYLGRGKGESALFKPSLLQFFCYFIQISN